MIVVKDNCNGCGICKVVCPYERMRIYRGKAFVEDCEECGVCLKYCPLNALEIRRELRTYEVVESIAQTEFKGGSKVEVREVKPKEIPIPKTKFALKFEVEGKPPELLRICSRCGACLLCPDEALDLNDKPILVGDCRECAFCLYVCPKFNEECVEEFRFVENVNYVEALKRLSKVYKLIIWDSVGDLDGVLSRMKLEFDEESCVGCGLCAKVCPISAIEFGEKPKFNSCYLCGLCVERCPQGAIRKVKYPTVKLLKEDFDKAVFVGFPCDVLAVKRLNDDRIVCLVSLDCRYCQYDENCDLKDCADITVGEKTVVRTERGERIWRSLE